MGDPGCGLPVLCQGPPPRDCAHGHPIWESLVSCEDDSGFSPFLGVVPFPAVLMHHGSCDASIGETKGMGEPLGQGQAGLALPQRLLWIAEVLQRPPLEDEGTHGRIVAIHKGQRTVLLRVILGHALLTVLAGSVQLAQAE